MRMVMTMSPQLALSQNCTVCGKALSKSSDRADSDDIERAKAAAGIECPEIESQCPKCGQWTRNEELKNMVTYLEDIEVVEVKRVDAPRWANRTADGYTKKCGAPTQYMVRLSVDNRWRRLWRWQFSNAGTNFVRINGKEVVVRDYDISDDLTLEADERHAEKYRRPH